MQNLYLIDPYRTSLETVIAESRPDGRSGARLSLEQTIIRPGGGGQPADRARVTWQGATYDVADITKAEGRTWLAVPSLAALPSAGDAIECAVDADRRRHLTQCHSLIHVVMAALRWTVAGYASRGAEISSNEAICALWFEASHFDARDRAQADAFARRVILADHRVQALSVKTPDTAAAKFPHWRVDPALQLTGKIRVIEIGDDIDANPCSGTHVRSTGEIGPFAFIDASWRPDMRCFELLVRRQDAWSYWYADSQVGGEAPRKVCSKAS